MGYLHIENLYRNRNILLFKRIFALEKVHGTSAHIKWDGEKLTYFAGGENYERFVLLFNEAELIEKFKLHHSTNVIIYGEAYGGKQQGMSHTYGKDLKFIVFDVKVNDYWLTVPRMDNFATSLGLEVVPWREISADLTEIDAERDRPSEVAERRGMGADKQREGVVLRPLEEWIHQGEHGGRIIAKHKIDKFQERQSQPKVVDADKAKVLADAQEIAEEWVVPMRLQHILDKFPNPSMEQTKEIVSAMKIDVYREAKGEIVESPEVLKAIGKKTVELLKQHLKNQLV